MTSRIEAVTVLYLQKDFWIWVFGGVMCAHFDLSSTKMKWKPL
jgi:hypothetical protein